MNIVDKATNTQLANIEKRTGKTLKQLTETVRESGLIKHSEIRDFLIREYGLGFGDAAVLTGTAMKALDPEAAKQASLSLEEVVDGFYSGAKKALRPIHDKIMAEIRGFGEFEIAPKKTYLSLRRKRQFAMLGPATNTRVDLGLNMKGVAPTNRLLVLPPGQMCQYQVHLANENEVNAEVLDWLRQAYEASG